MNPIEQCERLIDTAWGIFEQIPLGREMLQQLSDLRVKLHQPCVLAIAGKVKAGKSSFLNALIGEDLAKVGDLETTATINFFRYGTPSDPSHPIKVVWDDGHESFEDSEFMDSLQGHDSEALQRALGISHLEYYIDNPLLKELILVDTPGTGAVIEEHQKITEKYFNLRDKHQKQTLQCTDNADAVVYLLGAVANVSDKKFLDEFREISRSGNNINSIGILSKVDIDAHLLQTRHDQASYLANSLKEQLNTVIPVSSGLYKALKQHASKFEHWQRTFKSIDRKAFDLMMMSVKMYSLPTACNLPLDDRMAIKGDMPWSVFRTIAVTLYYSQDLETAIATINEMANIDAVRNLIKEYFFARSKIIRCNSVLAKLHALVIQLLHLGIFRMQDEAERFDRWIKFVSLHATDPMANGLREYLADTGVTNDKVLEIKEWLTNYLKKPIELLQLRLRDDDLCFTSLKTLQAHRDKFSESDYEELSALFSKKTLDVNPSERASYWNAIAILMSAGVKRDLANNASYIYSKK